MTDAGDATPVIGGVCGEAILLQLVDGLLRLQRRFDLTCFPFS
jgi:hypothetical protein